MKEKKLILFVHNRFHIYRSFAVIDNIKKKLSAYDSGIRIGGGHKKPNEILKASFESTTGENRQTGQVQVPQGPAR